MTTEELFNAKLGMLFTVRREMLRYVEHVEGLRLRFMRGVLTEEELGLEEIPPNFIDLLSETIRKDRFNAEVVGEIIGDVIAQFKDTHVRCIDLNDISPN
jgi:hypothetical protein